MQISYKNLDQTAKTETETEDYGAVVSDEMEGTERGGCSAHIMWIVFALHAAAAFGLAIALSVLIGGAK